MNDTIKAVFELGRAAMLAVRNGKIIHMNSRAKDLFGCDRTGTSPVGLVPDHLLFGSSVDFASTAVINDCSCLIQVKILDGTRYISIEKDPSATLSNGVLNSGLITNMLSTLFNIGLAIDRVSANSDGNGKLPDYIAILNHNYYILRHSLSNLSSSIALKEGSLPFHFSPVDLARLCSDIVSTVSLLCSNKGIDINFSTRHGQLYAYADSDKVERILLNLISNALAHTPRGGRISINLDKSGDTAFISVDDNGCGIAPHMMAQLFTAYERGPNLSDPSSFSGGLGLGISKALAEAHDGALLIESRQGEGCCVRVVLPLKTASFNTLESPAPNYVNSGINLILTELSSILDSRCYTEKYLD